MTERFIIATRNKKKIVEIARMLDGLGIELVGLDQYPDCPEVVEDAPDFEGNALKKARAVATQTGLPALADDSGLEVDALGGGPGVLSARYSGQGATDASNLDKVLSELTGIAEGLRTGRFRCVIALVYPDGRQLTFGGKVEGNIATSARGNNGFGYDPVFVPEGHAETFAEMSASEKDSMSHRGHAIEALRAYLRARVV